MTAHFFYWTQAQGPQISEQQQRISAHSWLIIISDIHNQDTSRTEL